MNNLETENNRRDFLKKCGLATAPLLLSSFAFAETPLLNLVDEKKEDQRKEINFFTDGIFFSPQGYIDKLSEINKLTPIEQVFYGGGGPTELLEKEFAKITGKEKAIFVPTGTMANQIALRLLSGNNTKVIVPENSHIFRDEADAAQSVHNKRLVPIGKDKNLFVFYVLNFFF